MTTTNNKFSSEGFDLEALEHATDSAVLELTATGGCQAVEETPKSKESTKESTNTPVTEKSPPCVMDEAEDWKQKGNAAFAQRDWDSAYDCYTKAIEATPGNPTGPELLQLQEEWQKQQNIKARQRLQKQEEERRKQGAGKNDDKGATDDDDTTDDAPSNDEPGTFQPPRHPHNNQLAVYYNNRAAAALQQADNSSVILEETTALSDCNVAVLLDPRYVKAWVRRATIYERLEKTDLALADAQQAVQLEPSNKKFQQTVQRLQKLEEARLEQLKEETLGKLKDLGNSILGNFGLSLDNFETKKDPNTGSYSISFNQNK